MSKNKGGFDIVKSGMEIVRGGFDNATRTESGKRCVCNPGGWSHGNLSGNGCACGCFTTGSQVNNTANKEKAGN